MSISPEVLEQMKKELEALRAKSQVNVEQTETVVENSGDSQISAEEAAIEASLSDKKSIWVGKLDFTVTKEKLEGHFHVCGKIMRTYIARDPRTKRVKGYSYIEFEKEDAVEAALSLNDTLFLGKNIVVRRKRHNIPKRHPRRFRR